MDALRKVPTVNWEAMEWRPVRRGIERKAFTGDGATVALHRISPGHEVLPHSHHFEQLVYIIDGEVDFTVGDEVVRLTAGGLLAVPPGVEHCVTLVGEKPALNLDIFTPARPDYVA